MRNLLISIPDGSAKSTFLNEENMAFLREHFNITDNKLGRQFTNEELKELLKNQDAVLTCWGSRPIQGEVIEGNDRLKVVAHVCGSVADYVDDTTYDKGIKVICGNRYFAESVAEGVVGFMMSLLRYIPDTVYDMKNGVSWGSPYTENTEGLLDREIGIVGFGQISTFLVEFLQAFHCTFKIYSAYPIDPEFLKKNHAKQVPLNEVFETCSIVTVHSALTKHNTGLIGKEQFELMKPGSIFINTSRGAVIKEDEMIEFLKKGTVRAMLDVYCVEPLPLDNPLRTMKNVYCIPHKGGPTVDRRGRIANHVVTDLVKILDGEEVPTEVTRELCSRMTSMTKH